MASNKPSRNPGFMKCTRPYCKECRPRFSSTPVSISEVRSLENARVPVSNVPPRAEKTVAIGISRVPTVQQTKSAVGSLATLSIIGVHRECLQTIKPNWKSIVLAQKQKEKKEIEEKLVEKFKDINLDESPTE